MKRAFFSSFFITEKNINTDPHKPVKTKWGKIQVV